MAKCSPSFISTLFPSHPLRLSGSLGMNCDIGGNSPRSVTVVCFGDRGSRKVVASIVAAVFVPSHYALNIDPRRRCGCVAPVMNIPLNVITSDSQQSKLLAFLWRTSGRHSHGSSGKGNTNAYEKKYTQNMRQMNLDEVAESWRNIWN